MNVDLRKVVVDESNKSLLLEKLKNIEGGVGGGGGAFPPILEKESRRVKMFDVESEMDGFV